MSIPPRWLLCPRRGKPIEGSKFIPFKVPLDRRYDAQVQLVYRFHPAMLIEAFKTDKIKIGLIIDLTKTDRYYDKNEFVDRGAAVIKLPCAGHGSVPEPERVEAFINICKQFWTATPNEYIGVHCTHGFNRTGYMICSYLVRELSYSIEAAVLNFTAARPPGIYKEDYVRTLFKLYDGNPAEIEMPELPDWEVPDGSVADDEDAPERGVKRAHDGDDEDASDSKRKQELATLSSPEGKEFATQIGGDLMRRVQSFMQTHCGYRGNDARYFPGAQPVSMDIDNFLELIVRDSDQDWLVSYKADGTRYLMAVMEEGVFLANRDFKIFRVPDVVFLVNGALDRTMTNTLVDGELVIDEYQEKNETKRRMRYLMYDLMTVNGKDVGQEPYSTRLKLLHTEVFVPREQAKAMKQNAERFSKEPFGIRVKIFEPLELFEKVAKMKLYHETDGFIFAPVKQPYKPGTNDNLLKWKPIEMNSIDFKLEIFEERLPGKLPEKIPRLYVQGDGNMALFSTRMANPIKEISMYNGKIIECNPIPDGHGNWLWKFHRERTDKSHPNANRVADAVVKSLNRGMSLIDLTTKLKIIIERRKAAAAAAKAASTSSSSISSSTTNALGSTSNS